ncbi:MAG: DUF1549 domain-containing protein [Rubripirellula sp.]
MGQHLGGENLMHASFLNLATGITLLLCLGSLSQADEVDFDHQVVPILKQHCVKCHAGEEAEGGFSLNDRSLFLEGDAAVPSDPDQSLFLQLIASTDSDLQMPPKDHARVPKEQQKVLARWIAEGMPWTAGFTFAANQYRPPLLPRTVELPGPADRNPIDQILSRTFQGEAVDDGTFLRRASLDLIGLLPTTDELRTFAENPAADKRADLVDALLSRETDYAEHWLTFWNDWLRNDYAGTGFITGGRQQISDWLYRSLIDNKPYDQFTRELVAPESAASRGFIDGIKWRGEVSAGQTIEIQFAQSVAQSFMGINLKCASCHDSFIDRWKLSEAYSLAAVYAQEPLDIHRCDQPTGDQAHAGWLFPELGEIDAEAPREQRLKQLASLITHRDNGRYARTIVNRLWAQLMGRGIIHPLDAMHTEPWNADLLDFLANDFVANGYNIKATLRLIATSDAYAARSEVLISDPSSESAYLYRGRRAKRMTAEQFLDCVWQITAAGPLNFDAPVMRGKVDEKAAAAITPSATWIWGDSAADGKAPPAGDQVLFRRAVKLDSPVVAGSAVVSADNEFKLYIARRLVAGSTDWTKVQTVAMAGRLKKGDNEILVVARNGGKSANLAGFYFESYLELADGSELVIASDDSWRQSTKGPLGGREGRLGRTPGPWKKVTPIKVKAYDSIRPQLQRGLANGTMKVQSQARASLLKSDFLMRSLGRPNRDQIVTSRPSELTTLEAIDLANGDSLSSAITKGAEQSLEDFSSTTALVGHAFRFALSREPTPSESKTILAAMGERPSQQDVEDLLWAVFMMPEFLMVR